MVPHEFGWFGAGYAVAKGGTAPDDYYPPLNDMEAQHEWLGGFGAGWVECPDEEAIASILFGDGSGGESIDEAWHAHWRGERISCGNCERTGREGRVVH